MLQQKIYSYFDNDPELRVLFIFNDQSLQLDELNSMTWKEGYRYVTFEKACFTCKYLLDTEWKNDKVILYLDEPSPLRNRERREKFLLMDVLVANKEFHDQDYVAFMQQHNIPETMSAFIERNLSLLQSSKMLALLEPYYNDKTINNDVATRGFLSMFLGQQRVLDWDDILIRVLLLSRSSESKKQDSFYKRLQDSKVSTETLEKRFMDIFGVTIKQNSFSKVEPIVESFKYNAITENLNVIEADNYKKYKITNPTALQRINRLLELVLSNSNSAAAFNELMNELGDNIRSEEIFRWYGIEADYHFIPEELSTLILQSILNSDISSFPKETIERVENIMIKQKGNSSLDEVMDFIVRLAQYYEKIISFENKSLKTIDEFVGFYEKEFYKVDQLYRQILGIYYNISLSCPLYDKIQEVKGRLDDDYAKVSNRVNLAWTKCLKESGGLGSLSMKKQWNFYEQQIKPIQKKVAIIVSDALRYEMAQQLIGEIGKSKHVAKLYPWIATLPTETKFCKPTLLPHKKIALLEGNNEPNMIVDDVVLNSTEKRSNHLQRYNSDAICMQFEQIARNSQTENRNKFKSPIVYIYHNDIDEIGHSDSAKNIVFGCNRAIKEIAEMIPRIHATWNVTEVIVTSDHGFLFNDIEFEERDKQQVTEDVLEKKSRYYLTRSENDVQGVIKFPLEEVSGMEGVEGVKVAVPEGTNRFAAPSGGYMFAHGGASLQEVIIPVIVSHQERTDTKEPVGVTILDNRLSMQSSRLRFNLLQTQAVSMDRKERTINVALYYNDEPVTPIIDVLLNKTDSSLDNRKIPVDLTLSKNISANILQLKVYDIEDNINPLIVQTVTNNTLIQHDFDFE